MKIVFLSTIPPTRKVSGLYEICYQGPLLLTWFNFNPSMDK